MKKNQFNEWFGSSRVVGKDGSPLLVFRGEHGDTGGDSSGQGVEPTIFQTRLGSLSFGSVEAASLYATEPNSRRDDAQAASPRVIPAYLRIDAPLIDTPDDPFIDMARIRALLGDVQARRIALKFADEIENTGHWQDDYAQANPQITSFIETAPFVSLDDLYFNVWSYLDDADEVKLLREAGIDGAIYGGSGANALEPEYRVFGEHQVQSAIETGWPTRPQPAPVELAIPPALRQSNKSTVAKVRKALVDLIGESAVSLGEGLGRLVVTTSREIQVPGYAQMPANALASLTSDPYFRQIIAEGRAARTRAIAAIGDVQECAILRHDSGGERWKMILRDASEQGKWRTQAFDAKGFSGHMTFATRELAIEDAASSSFTVRDDGALDRVQDSPAFQRGLFTTDLIGLINSKQITHDEGDRRLAVYDEMSRALNSIAATGAQAFIAAGRETIYLMADRIEEGAEQAVFQHEITHRYGRSVLGAQGWGELIGSLKGWSSKPVGSVERLIHDRANARARAAAGDKKADSPIFEDELFAYGVEEAVSLGIKPSATAHADTAEQWLDEVANTLRRVVSDTLGGRGLLSPQFAGQQLVDLAYALAQLENPERTNQILSRMTLQERSVLQGVIARAGSPVWYSQLELNVRQQPQAQMVPGQWAAWINAQTTKGVKPDEVMWSGVQDWLKLQTGKISKEQVQAYLDANGVHVEETVLTDSPGATGETAYRDRLNSMDNDELRAEADENDVEYDSVNDTNRARIINDIVASYGEGLGSNLDREIGQTKYGQYTLPGGENYREVLLTLPTTDALKVVEHPDQPDGFAIKNVDGTYVTQGENTQNPGDATLWLTREYAQDYGIPAHDTSGAYASSHWPQLNVLAHMRLNDQVDAKGEKTLFIQEIQSDWAQDWKRKGFSKEFIPGPGWTASYKEENDAWTVTAPGGMLSQFKSNGIRVESEAITQGARNLSKVGVPLAPFVTTTNAWVSLAIKRIIKMAVDGGYDNVAFINGQQSVDRYDLSKQVKSLSVAKMKDGTFTMTAETADGSPDRLPDAIPENKLADYVGKELAARIIADVGGKDRFIKEYRGIDLKFGGEGMKVFYDQIVPNVIKDVLKKFGATPIEKISFGKPGLTYDEIQDLLQDFDTYPADSSERAELRAKQESAPDDRTELQSEQLGFSITPKMRASARFGMPMFSLELTAAVAQYAQGADPDVIEAQAQCAAVVSANIGTHQWMKSPNGLPTKLTQSQWVLVRTKNFKNWFGDWINDPERSSQAVDGATGEPCVMYHGTPDAGFSEFDAQKRRRGYDPSIFFTSDLQVARSYAGTNNEAEITAGQTDEDGYEIEGDRGIYSAFLNIREPHITDFEGANWDGTRAAQWSVVDPDEEFEIPIPNENGKLYFDDKAEAQRFADSLENCEVVAAPESFESTNSCVAEAKKYGCDGALMYDVVDEGHFSMGCGPSHVFAVFKANQIKSATQNEGTFYKDSWDIRYSIQAPLSAETEPTQTPAFQTWSENLPFVNEFDIYYKGGPAVFEAFHGTTHTDINVFKEQGNKEGYLGAGPYFSTSAKDASVNYSGVGPDLTVRINTEAENIANDIDSYAMRDLLRDYYDAHESITPAEGWEEGTSNELLDAWNEHGDDAATFSATQNLKGDSDGFMMKVYVKLSNPADTTGRGQDLTYEVTTSDDGERSVETGTLVDWIMAARSVANDYVVDIEPYINALLKNESDVGMDEAFNLARKYLSDVYDNSGEIINAGGLFREIAREAGYDGVIMDADLHFGSGRRGFGGTRLPIMEGINSGTLHIVPFSPEQVKSAIGNNGQFDSENADIRFSMPSGSPSHQNNPAFSAWFGDSAVIDKSGDPLVVYHGTDSIHVDEFVGRESVGWFSSDPAFASKYAEERRSGAEQENINESRPNVLPVYLSITKPLILPFDMNDTAALARPVAESLGLSWGKFSWAEKAHEVVNNSDFFSAMERAKFDGVVVKERGVQTFAPVRATQIKSSISNNGKFDTANVGIRFSKPAEMDALKAVPNTVRLFKAAIKPYKDSIYHDLIETAGCGPFDGGCVVFAQALQRVMGGNIVVITGANDRGDHAGVELNGKLYDFDGPLTPAAFMTRFEKNEQTKITGYRPMSSTDLLDAYRGIDLENALVSKLRDAFPTNQVQKTDKHRGSIPHEHSAEFMRWFDGSQVSDEQGVPRTMYHSTVAEFDKFKRKGKDIGIHFGTKGQAEDRFLLKISRDPYGPDVSGVKHSTIPVYLSIKRALRMPDVGNWADRDNLITQLPDEFTIAETLKTQSVADVQTLIKSHGYDGIVYKNTGETAGGALLRNLQRRASTALYGALPGVKNAFSIENQSHPLYIKYSAACDAYREFREKNAEDSWIAFKPDQIKSAILNRAAFVAPNANALHRTCVDADSESARPKERQIG